MNKRIIKKFNRLDKLNLLTGIEDPIWYDGIAYYEDSKGNRYSRHGNPIERYELCKHGFIFEVILITDWPWPYNYHYEIANARPDTIRQYDTWSNVKLKYLLYNKRLYNMTKW